MAVSIKLLEVYIYIYIYRAEENQTIWRHLKFQQINFDKQNLSTRLGSSSVLIYIIQILTATVMKCHFSVDCQESYIFPRGYIFPKRTALRENIITRENITILAPPTRDISSVPVNICYIRWSKWMISSKFDGAVWLSRSLVTRLGVCVQTMWTQTWQICALSIMTFYC